MGKEDLLHKLTATIVNGDEKAASEVALEILAAGIDPIEAILQGATKGLDLVGERYQSLEAFLPDLILAGDAMKACVAILISGVSKEKAKEISLGKVVIGTVSGDIHDIGKNIVATMLLVTGFEIHDLGISVPVKLFIEKAEEIQARVIALSALMTTSAYYQREVIDYLKDSGLRNKYYIVVGGGPVLPEWAAEIGADGYGRSAIDACKLVKELVTGGTPPPLSRPLVFK